jgi:hypothetical protein
MSKPYEVYDKNTEETLHSFKRLQDAFECCDELNETHDEPLYSVRENAGKGDDWAGRCDDNTNSK